MSKNALDDLFSVGVTPLKRDKKPRLGNYTPGHTPGYTPSSAVSSSTAYLTPQSHRTTPFSSAGPLSSPLSAVKATPRQFRPDAVTFAVQDTLNPALELAPVVEADAPRIKLFSQVSLDKRQYRYQFEKLSERADVLDNAIDELADLLQQHYSLSEIADPGVQSQEEVFAVGRICLEDDPVKLSVATTCLETSRILGNGSRVRLTFAPDLIVRGLPRGSEGLTLFPGCIVGVRGHNGGGRAFSVSEILVPPPMEAAYTRPSEILAGSHGTGPKALGGSPMGVIVAAGPYTVESNLEYEPLRVLTERLMEEKPDLVIMTGPFVDADHPLIKTGNIDMLPTEIFKTRISSSFIDLLRESPKTTIILIPNERDIISAHVAFPQSPLPKLAELGLPKGVKLLPNPTTFSVNEVLISIASVDVIKHLMQSQVAIKGKEPAHATDETLDPTAKDAMTKLSRHILRQRSLYPLFPAPLAANGANQVSLDLAHNDFVKMGSVSADIIIVPSMLKYFNRIVDSTVVINPSYLTRGETGGTYARLTIHPLPKEELEKRVSEKTGYTDAAGNAVEGEEDEPMEHRVWERCRVDTIKL